MPRSIVEHSGGLWQILGRPQMFSTNTQQYVQRNKEHFIPTTAPHTNCEAWWMEPHGGCFAVSGSGNIWLRWLLLMGIYRLLIQLLVRQVSITAISNRNIFYSTCQVPLFTHSTRSSCDLVQVNWGSLNLQYSGIVLGVYNVLWIWKCASKKLCLCYSYCLLLLRKFWRFVPRASCTLANFYCSFVVFLCEITSLMLQYCKTNASFQYRCAFGPNFAKLVEKTQQN